MERIIIQLKDINKRAMLFSILEKLPFINVISTTQIKAVEAEKEHDFFSSAGLFEGRDIDANELRKSAWSR
ncbi:MAG: hypothetical protein AB8F95_08810 [Bacteroidia bacterium]